MTEQTYTAEQYEKAAQHIERMAPEIGQAMPAMLRQAAQTTREREPVKVTDEDVCDAMTVIFGNAWKPHCDEYFRVRAALESFAACPAAVPDGWKLVPREASLGMLDAGWGICGTRLSREQPNVSKIREALRKYNAMLAAAPEVTK